MGLIDAVSSAFAPDTDSTEPPGQSDGAYWCDDCGVRVHDVDVEDEGLDRADDGTPECPECGNAMRFEKSHADGCAC
jgi:C4-type Zn-finger protein